MLTLLDSARFARENGLVHKASIIETYVAETDLFQVLPFINIGGSAYGWNEEATLPGAATRLVNASYTASEGKITPRVQSLKICGGELKVDRALIKMHGPEQRAYQERAKTKAISRYVGNLLVEGDDDTNPADFPGLKKLFPTTGSRALDITASGSAGPVSMKKLDELQSMVDNPTHWLWNQAMERNVRAYLRSGGSGAASIYMDRDAFGRPVMTYGGLPVLIADRNGAPQTLQYTETSSTASCFCLSISPDGYHGIQNGEMDVKDMGEMQASPHFLTRLEWLAAQVVEGPRAVARGYDFTNATAVA